MRASTLLILSSTLAMAPAAIAADTVTLTGGDRLHGQVLDANDESVVLEHPLLGVVTLPAPSVAAITYGDAPQAAADDPEAADAMEPAGEEAGVTDEVTPADADAAAVDTLEPSEAPQAPGPAVVPAPRGGIFGTGWLEDWASTLSLGFSGAHGPTDEKAVNASFKTLFKDDDARITWNNQYFLSVRDGNRSRNEFKTELTRDWLFTDSPWFLFANGVYQYNQFQTWENRVSAFGGFGYTFMDRSDIELLGRIGFGGTYEFGDINELTPEALVGVGIARWRITEYQTLEFSNTFYPSLEDMGEFRNTTSLEWILKLPDMHKMSLKLGLKNEYQTQNVEHKNDLKYYGAVGFEF